MSEPQIDFTRFQFTITVDDRKTGKQTRLRFMTRNSAQLFVGTDEEPVGVLHMEPDGTRLDPAPGMRDAVNCANCIRECARGCDGNPLCAAECVAMCLTILPD